MNGHGKDGPPTSDARPRDCAGAFLRPPRRYPGPPAVALAGAEGEAPDLIELRCAKLPSRGVQKRAKASSSRLAIRSLALPVIVTRPHTTLVFGTESFRPQIFRTERFSALPEGPACA